MTAHNAPGDAVPHAADKDWGKHYANPLLLMQMLERNMGVESFHLDLPRGQVYLSDAACPALGYAPTRDPIQLGTSWCAKTCVAARSCSPKQ